MTQQQILLWRRPFATEGKPTPITLSHGSGDLTTYVAFMNSYPILTLTQLYHSLLPTSSELLPLGNGLAHFRKTTAEHQPQFAQETTDLARPERPAAIELGKAPIHPLQTLLASTTFPPLYQLSQTSLQF